MKKNQKIFDGSIQICGFPMRYMNITQGNNGGLSHQGVNALDLAGKNAQVDDVYALCDSKLIWRDTYINGNALFFQSVTPVKVATKKDGKYIVSHVTYMIIHDDYVDDICAKGFSGHIFKQGEVIAQEGMAGRATGNHCHFEIALGTYGPAYTQNPKTGVWHLTNSISADRVCFTNGTLIIDGDGMNWKDYIGWTFSESKKKWWWDNGDETYPHDVFKDINGKTYYFDSDGWMVEGWKKINSKWYYFTPSKGNRVTNWVKIKDIWYFFNSEGVMQYGWIDWNGKRYFTDGKGRMVTGEYVIDGVEYQFDKKSGKLIDYIDFKKVHD